MFGSIIVYPLATPASASPPRPHITLGPGPRLAVIVCSIFHQPLCDPRPLEQRRPPFRRGCVRFSWWPWRPTAPFALVNKRTVCHSGVVQRYRKVSSSVVQFLEGRCHMRSFVLIFPCEAETLCLSLPLPLLPVPEAAGHKWRRATLPLTCRSQAHSPASIHTIYLNTPA